MDSDDKEQLLAINAGYPDENLEKLRLKLELDRDRHKWKIRRRLAISSFLMNCVLGLLFVFAPFLFDSVEKVKALVDFNSIIIAVIGSNSSIILLYIGAVTYSDSTGMKVSVERNVQ